MAFSEGAGRRTDANNRKWGASYDHSEILKTQFPSAFFATCQFSARVSASSTRIMHHVPETTVACRRRPRGQRPQGAGVPPADRCRRAGARRSVGSPGGGWGAAGAPAPAFLLHDPAYGQACKWPRGHRTAGATAGGCAALGRRHHDGAALLSGVCMRL